MFSHLDDLSYRRSGKEAVGFYLAFTLLIILCGAFAGIIFALVTHVANYSISVRLGILLAVIFTSGLSFTILGQKHQLSHAGYLMLALLSAICAVIGGAILGMIVVAYLTTRPVAGVVPVSDALATPSDIQPLQESFYSPAPDRS